MASASFHSSATPIEKTEFCGPSLTPARRAQCIRNGEVYSWQGQAALGGFIGDDFDSFFSSVVSGAAGTYMATLGDNSTVHTGLTLEPGQVPSPHLVLSVLCTRRMRPPWLTDGMRCMYWIVW